MSLEDVSDASAGALLQMEVKPTCFADDSLAYFRSNTVNPALLCLDCGGMMVVHIVMSALSATACKQFVPAQVARFFNRCATLVMLVLCHIDCNQLLVTLLVG